MKKRLLQPLKTKNIKVISGQLFCCQFKAKFFLVTETQFTDDEDKVQSVTDTDNKFTECQTPRKKLQPIDISPVILHAVHQHSRITNEKMNL